MAGFVKAGGIKHSIRRRRLEEMKMCRVGGSMIQMVVVVVGRGSDGGRARMAAAMAPLPSGGLAHITAHVGGTIGGSRGGTMATQFTLKLPLKLPRLSILLLLTWIKG